MSSTKNDEDLRAQLETTPGKVVDILFARYHPALLRLARAYVIDEKVCDDIVQEAFVALWFNHKSLASVYDKPLYAYLVKIVKNKAISHLRDMKRFRHFQTKVFDFQFFSTVSPPADQEMERKESFAILQHAILKLTKRQRECMTLRLEQELSNQEIANLFGVKVKAVEANFTSAFKRLREIYQSMQKKSM